MKKVCTVLSILLLLLPLTIGAAIIVTYEPVAALHFEQGFSPMNTNKLVARLGTLTFTKTGNSVLYDPTLLTTTMSWEFYFTGPMTWHNDQTTGKPVYNDQSTRFVLYAVSTVNGQSESRALYYGAAHPLRTNGGTINANPFVVHLYVLSDQDVDHYKIGGSYQLTTGSLAGFQVALANSSLGYYNGATNVSVNGASPTANTPILTPGTNPSNPIIFGDPPQQVNYDFAIVNKQAITLANAVGNLKTKVADAQITVTNGQANKNYGVNVIFTNQANTNPFRLTMQNVTNPPTIPYYLYFNNKTVTPGGNNQWTNLKNGIPKTLDIQVTGVLANDANMALAGSYQDVIIVNIIPIET